MRQSVVVLSVLVALGAADPALAQARSGGATLAPFASDRELGEYLRALAAANRAAGVTTPGAVATCSGDTLAVTRHVKGSGGAPAVIHGQVRTVAGDVLPATLIQVPQTTLGTSADAEGRFRLELAPEQLAGKDTLRLRALRIGFQPLQRSLVIGAGDSVTLAVTLCIAPLELHEVVVTGAAADEARGAESITNVQHEGVDEGGIVKRHGDHLVVLRRGRLFTVAVGDGALRPVSTVDAFGPGIDPDGAWYDELLVAGDRVVVIGYSYARGGTEVGLFRIDRRGRLRHQATHHLRSDDYYTSRNYASRLVGDRLIFYTPQHIALDSTGALVGMPALRRWSADADERGWHRILSTRRLYRLPGRVAAIPAPTLHTVTVCDLAARELSCTASGVLGSPGAEFYVSPTAVYVWADHWTGRRSPRADATRARTAMIYRLPLDGGAPSAVGAAGSPVDQFSFLESDGQLHVVVRAMAAGGSMWRAERSGGAVALLRAPLSSFGDGRALLAPSRYRSLPAPVGPTFQNRFVGAYLLYGSGSGWGHEMRSDSLLYAVPWRGGAVSRVPLGHGVDRIERMGGDAVVVGSGEHALHFSGIRLTGAPMVEQRYAMAGASQGELRSHGFFYRADGEASGVFGLPVRGPGRPGYEHLYHESASIVFVRNAERRFQPLGELRAHDGTVVDDDCKASCVDWYGNARPLFVDGRLFALLGYELVEGRVDGGAIRELRRVSFAPTRGRAADR